MNWKIDKSRAICPQIFDRICARIATEELYPNEKLQSVRELALFLGVNPNTVQKAYENLEKEGVLYSVRGSGWFVGRDIDIPRKLLAGKLHEKTADYFLEMRALGMDTENVKNYVKEWKE